MKQFICSFSFLFVFVVNVLAQDSANYILNRTQPTQVANFNIAGYGAFVHNGSNNFSSTLLIQNATGGGANMQLSGEALPSLATWMRDGTGFVEKMRLTSIGNLGIGEKTPDARLTVSGDPGTFIAKFIQNNVAGTDASISIKNATSSPGAFIPNLAGRSSMPGRSFGLYISGEAEDVLPASDVAMAAVILDGRTKTNTRLTTNNVLAVNSNGVNLMQVKADGSVGIGTTDTKGYKLAVNGSGIFTKVVVKAYNNWPDFVFEHDYQLPTLGEMEAYVRTHKHLPEIPSAAEVAEKGVDLGEMNQQLLKKVEEQMLYMIEMNKKITSLTQEVQELKKKIAQ